MINLHSYITTVEDNIEKWQKEILRFRIIAEEADPDPQVEHYKVLDDIVAKEDAVKEKLSELKEHGEAGWSAAAMEKLDGLQKTLDEAIESARYTIN